MYNNLGGEYLRLRPLGPFSFVTVAYNLFWLEGLLMGSVAGLLLLIFHKKPTA